MWKFMSLLIIYMIFPYEFSISVKFVVDPDQECKRCKVLTDSFDHWLEKTSRGKFEGGDAAWEETKLRSYSRSEVRLVEVQEGLCSEVNKQQDQCYGLAEEVEQLLEKWWFQNDANNGDLYTWLCIETIRHCCPQQHFGETCLPCPTDKNNKICAGNGQCDGEGTRKGNGSCICNRGFAGANCEDCANDHYRDNLLCEPCHKSCNGCSGPGNMACFSCKAGWIDHFGTCVDHDECTDSSVCKANQYCINKEGYYLCKTCHSSCNTCVGPGNGNCTECDKNYKMWSGICMDKKLREELLMSTLRKLALYFGLLVILIFIIRTHKQLASLVTIILAIYVYISETTSSMNIADVVYNHMYS